MLHYRQSYTAFSDIRLHIAMEVCGICTLSKGEHGDYDYGWMVFGLFRLGERSDRRGRDKFPMLKGFKPTPLSATDVNQAQLLAGFLGRGCWVQNENSRFVRVGNQGL